MKVLLTTINSKYIHQNLAIRLLYALNRHHEELSWKEFASKDSLDTVVSYCTTFDLVAFSCYIWNITKIMEVISKLKEVNPPIKILLGGPEVSFDWETVIKNDAVDFIIPGEGELPFASFLNNYPDVSKTKGVVWKEAEEVYYNSSAEMFDLQTLRNINPYKFDSTEELRTKVAYVETSRGCPYRCAYCLASLDNKVRYLPVETFQTNMLYLMEHSKTIKFLDRTFNANPKLAIDTLQFILDNHKGKSVFQFEIKADLPQPELITFINENVTKGLFRFEIGIQTLNTQSGDAIQRKQNYENITHFIKAVEDKVELHLDLIVGLPHDYWEDIKYSFEEVFGLHQPELQLGFLKLLKGTSLRKNREEHAYKFDLLPPYQITESRYLSANELDQISLVEHALDIYWNKKRALHALKYVAKRYSIFDFLLGLGHYFKRETGLHRYDIKEIYCNLYDFSIENYPEDVLLPQIIALDYYLQSKIKPRSRFLPELERAQKAKIVDKLKLNHHKYRFAIHPITFSLEKFMKDGVIELVNDWLIVQYDGVNKCRVVIE